jgi:hypothetical protein
MRKQDWIELLLCILAGPFYPFHRKMLEEQRPTEQGEDDEEANCTR